MRALHTPFISALLAAAGVAGCAKAVDVQSTFPEPVLEPLPLSVGIRFPADLSNFVHTEDPLTDAEWEIAVGEANVQMFRAVFSAMFKDAIELNPESDEIPAHLRLDAVVEPRLNELEFAVPAHSGNDQFTVWMQYFVRVLDPQGEEIMDWEVTAYGQQDQGRLGLGAEGAMEAAAVKALRDAGANIAVNFARQPQIEERLLGKNAESDIDPSVEAELSDEDVTDSGIADSEAADDDIAETAATNDVES